MAKDAAETPGTKFLPPDDEARRLISSELDTTMLVEAAAGTGKTTKMVDRMVALLAEGKCRIETLAAVTFTRKAAAELRSRFHVALEVAARGAGPPARERLEEAVGHVERCFIGTIHSFCGRLLRERPVEAGVSVTFEEVDDRVDERLREQAWDAYVAGLIALDDPILSELDDLGLEIGALAGSFKQLAEYPDVDEWPAPPLPPPDLKQAVETLQDYAGEMTGVLSKLPGDRGNDKLLELFERMPRLLSRADTDKPADVMEVFEEFRELGPRQVVHKQWPGKKAEAEAQRERWNRFWREVAAPLVENWRARRYHAAMRVILGCKKPYDELRSDSGRLNFQDLLLLAAMMLRDHPHVRRYFRRRFTHLLVDEFQDTDPIQAEVMLLLTAGDPDEKNWRRCRPVEGSLFVVGDPKQSIYRFRRADITVYNEVRGIIEKHGRVLQLSANFRTTSPVREWVNQTFADVFPPAGSEFQAARVPLGAGRSEDGSGTLAGVLVHRVPRAFQNKDDIAEHEAGLIARAIRDAIDHGLTVPRTRKELDAGVSPAAAAGDFMILTRRVDRLHVHARKLQELGIPHVVTGGSALNQVRELWLLHSCLKAVVEPDNPVALVAVLRGELFGVSDQTLYAHAREKGSFSYHTEPPARLPPADRQALSDAFERLTQYSLWLARLPPVAAIEKIVAHLGLAASAAARPGGDMQAGSLGKSVELLRAAQADQWTAADLVDYLGRLVEKEKDETHDGLPARPQDASAVRVMNLHKAKGLEAPIVFLADPSGEWHHEAGLAVDRSGGRSRGYLQILQFDGSQPKVLARPAGWEALAAREEQFAQAEKIRLLYVAATRAGTQLVISLREYSPGFNPWLFFEPQLAGCASLVDPGPQSPPACAAVPLTESEITRMENETRGRWAAAVEPTYAIQAAKAISVASTGPAASGEHGTEWGTVIHALLETAMREPSADLQALARAALGGEGLDPALADAAAASVSAVTRSEVWRRAQASPRRLIEVPFQTLLPAAGIESKPTILRGVIDLVFLEASAWVIVDYKTDDRPGEPIAALVAHYLPQLRAYAAAWEATTGERVRELGLYFTTTGRYHAAPR